MDGPRVQMPQVNVPMAGANADKQPVVTPEWASLFSGLQRIAFYSTRSGTTAERPTASTFRWVGMPYFDTTLGQPVFLKTASSNAWVTWTASSAAFQWLGFALTDETTPIATTGVFKRKRVPANTVLEVRASLNNSSATGSFVFDIQEAGVSILGVPLSIDQGETSSLTASSAATITAPNIADDAILSFLVTSAGSTAAGAFVEMKVAWV